MNYYLAIDIGASSGRHIVGWLEDGAVQTKEVYRSPTGSSRWTGISFGIWNLFSLM